MPILEKEDFFTLFDIPKEKREDFYCQKIDAPETFSFEDSEHHERIVDRAELALVANGTIMEPIVTSQGLMFIQERLLSPFVGLKDGFELYERINNSGQSYIAVKSGFLLLGVILPDKVRGEEGVKMLENLAALARVAYENERAEKLAEAIQMGLFNADQDTLMESAT